MKLNNSEFIIDSGNEETFTKQITGQKARDLLCGAMNEIIVRKLINLNTCEVFDKTIECTFLGRKSRIRISSGDKPSCDNYIEISWGIHTSKEIIATGELYEKETALVRCYGWLERKHCLSLQGFRGAGITCDFDGKDAQQHLLAIPVIEPIGFEKEGKIY